MIKIFIFIILLSLLNHAQSLKIEDIEADSGQTVNLSIIADNLQNIGSISIKISYDTNVVSFINLENLVRDDFLFFNKNGVVAISWIDFSLNNPLNMQDSSLLDIVFKYNSSNSTNVNFLTQQCELSDLSANIINVQFLNGSISYLTDFENSIENIRSFNLLQNYPNPFNPETTIQFTIGGNEETLNGVLTKLKIFDIQGKEVATLVNEEKAPGTYSIKYDGSVLPSGTYFYKLQAGDMVLTRKMMILK